MVYFRARWRRSLPLRPCFSSLLRRQWRHRLLNSAATPTRRCKSLYAKVPAAKAIGAKAQAILVFPTITKAGLGIGGQYGDGALIKGGKVVGYYNTSGISSGLQAGAQQYGYAMFFMNEAALKALDSTAGFEVGVGPSIVVMDEGKAKDDDHDA